MRLPVFARHSGSYVLRADRLNTGELLDKALAKARDDDVVVIPDLVDNEGRSAVPIESVKRHCCDGHPVVITETSEGGFDIRKDFLENWAFFLPDGIAVPEAGYVSRLGGNPPAGGLSSVAGFAVEEPPPPQYLH